MGFNILRTFQKRSEKNKKFNIYDENEWATIPNCPLEYKGEILIAPETGEAIKAGDFAKFLIGFQNFLRKQDENVKLGKQTIDNFLQRMLDAQHKKNINEEKFVLTSQTEDRNESGFNPFDKFSWNLASEKRIMRIKGVRLIKDDVFMSEKEFLHEIQLGIKYNINKKSIEELIESHLNLCFSLYAEKDLEPVFVVNGFSFSKALCDTAISTEKERLEKIAEAMNFCISQKLKKYQYKQYFFDNFIPADKEFFIEVYFAEQYKTRETVDNLIVAFYSEFEPSSSEEIEKIIGRSKYLAAHKELIPIVRENLEYNLLDDEE